MKKEFIGFLKENEAYDDFIINLVKDGDYTMDSLLVSDTVNGNNFIGEAFIWGDHIKDFDFWSDLSRKWEAKAEEIEVESKTRLIKRTFNNYLITVGIRSAQDYTYEDEDLFNNVEYFKKCYHARLSAYKALLFLHDYMNGDYDI
jgi:hypothetical protein